MTENLTPRTIWGKVILYLKEKRYISLQVACGDIVDVEIKDNSFIVRTEESLMFEVLTNEKNKKIIEEALNWQGYDGNLVIEKKQSKNDIIQSDLEKLKKYDIICELIGD